VSGESTCNSGCANTWTPFLAKLYELEIAANLNAVDLGTITSADGDKQVTIKGWPLYFFPPNSDGFLEALGDTLGDGRGGVFFIAKLDYTVLLAKQAVVEGEDPIVCFVNDSGVSIYFTEGDEENTSNCSGGCVAFPTPIKWYI